MLTDHDHVYTNVSQFLSVPDLVALGCTCKELEERVKSGMNRRLKKWKGDLEDKLVMLKNLAPPKAEDYGSRQELQMAKTQRKKDIAQVSFEQLECEVHTTAVKEGYKRDGSWNHRLGHAHEAGGIWITSLHYAAAVNDVQLCRILLERGARINDNILMDDNEEEEEEGLRRVEGGADAVSLPGSEQSTASYFIDSDTSATDSEEESSDWERDWGKKDCSDSKYHDTLQKVECDFSAMDIKGKPDCNSTASGGASDVQYEYVEGSYDGSEHSSLPPLVRRLPSAAEIQQQQEQQRAAQIEQQQVPAERDSGLPYSAEEARTMSRFALYMRHYWNPNRFSAADNNNQRDDESDERDPDLVWGYVTPLRLATVFGNEEARRFLKGKGGKIHGNVDVEGDGIMHTLLEDFEPEEKGCWICTDRREIFYKDLRLNNGYGEGDGIILFQRNLFTSFLAHHRGTGTIRQVPEDDNNQEADEIPNMANVWA